MYKNGEREIMSFEPNQNEKVVLILSGGLDSTTLLYHLIAEKKQVFALSFHYGQRHVKELKYAQRTCKKLGISQKIVDLQNIGELINNSSLTNPNIEVPEGYYAAENMKNTVVPNRNMIMVSIAMGYAINIGATAVFLGIHSGDHAIYPDCRPDFLLAMNIAGQYCHYTKIRVEAPYINTNKIGIVTRGLKLGVDYSLTWTCYKGEEKACGACGSCQERLEAFNLNNTKDPIEYV